MPPVYWQAVAVDGNFACYGRSDGLVLLGGGPWGSAGQRDLPTLQGEIALTRNMLDQGRPVLGIGLGAQILAIAAGGVFDGGFLERAVRLFRNEDGDECVGW